jgi:hypothetical protein
MRRGDILPFPAAVMVPKSSTVITALLVGCSMITSSVSALSGRQMRAKQQLTQAKTFGYDGSMM